MNARARARRASSPDLSPMAADVRAGLTGPKKWLPSYLFYDARGSELFEEITRLDEYYLTRTEIGILDRRAEEIAERVGPVESVVELGAGTGRKTPLVVDALVRRRGSAPERPPITYYPIDVSESALEIAVRNLGRHGVEVKPLVGQYEERLPEVSTLPGPRLLLFIGSSIGNYTPRAAARLLSLARTSLAPGDLLLCGADLRKDAATLVRAYDDGAGVTAAFNKNILVHLNRELGADFDPDRFLHVALWNARESRMEMHLESVRQQRVVIRDLDLAIDLRRGERIQTENSYKLSLPDQLRLFREAGLEPEKTWSDDGGLYAVHLARVP